MSQTIFQKYYDVKDAGKYYGCRPKYVLQLVKEGKLREFSKERGYPDVFPVPDGIGGRFSVFTPVGLYPAAVLGMDVRGMLQGAAEMTERFRTRARCTAVPI